MIFVHGPPRADRTAPILANRERGLFSYLNRPPPQPSEPPIRLPTPPLIALPLLFIAILMPALPVVGSDGTDEPSTISSPAPARLRMARETLDQTDPRNCVSQAAEMANAENLAGLRVWSCVA